MDTVVWIIIAVVIAILLIAAIILLARSSANKKRHAEAESIREQVREEHVKVERREALADETSARARAAKAEAEAKAAEAARLEERATSHRRDIEESRLDLDKQQQRADRLHPQTAEPAAADDVPAHETAEETAAESRRGTT